MIPIPAENSAGNLPADPAPGAGPTRLSGAAVRWTPVRAGPCPIRQHHRLRSAEPV